MRRTNPPEPSPLQTHDHEFRPVEEAPIIEDGAAIFREECEWVEITSSATSERHDETFYGTGAECDEYRTYRFEESKLVLNDGEERALDGSWDDYSDSTQVYVERITQQGDMLEVDPDEDSGRVVLEHEHKLIFEA